MKFISLFLALLFFIFQGKAGFYPYGGGYYAPPALAPTYSYQQPYGYYRGYSYSQQPVSSSPLACSAFHCDNLQGFKKCLADPTSPYRYFANHPAEATYTQALEKLRAFTTLNPNCYKKFCNRVCSTVPEKFQAAQNVPLEKRSWWNRQKDWYHKNEHWQAAQLEKRSGVENQIQQLCEREDVLGREIRILCSECPSFFKPDREMIPACRVNIDYTAQLKVRDTASDSLSESQKESPQESAQQNYSGANWGRQALASEKQEDRNPSQKPRTFVNGRGVRVRLEDGNKVSLERPKEPATRRVAPRREVQQARIERSVLPRRDLKEDPFADEDDQSEGDEEDAPHHPQGLPQVRRSGTPQLSRQHVALSESDEDSEDGDSEEDVGKHVLRRQQALRQARRSARPQPSRQHAAPSESDEDSEDGDSQYEDSEVSSQSSGSSGTSSLTRERLGRLPYQRLSTQSWVQGGGNYGVQRRGYAQKRNQGSRPSAPNRSRFSDEDDDE